MTISRHFISFFPRQSIKKYLEQSFAKKPAVSIFKKAIMKLADTGLILNTTQCKGVGGSFKINPDRDNFDSRGMYVDKELDEYQKVFKKDQSNLSKFAADFTFAAFFFPLYSVKSTFKKINFLRN